MNIVKELMIGDLVNYRPGWINEETNQVEYECNNGFPVKIEMLYYSGGEWLVQYNDGENDGIEAAEYELFPIPITAEILEKNGFERGTYELPVSGKKIPKYSYAEVEGDIKEVALLPLTMNSTWSFSAVDGTHIPVLQFVHQLQHALHLCGIDYEIKL